MKTALITGADGFIGRHMAAALEGNGWHVTGVDIKSGTECRDIFATSVRFDLVVHCAAIVGGRAMIDGQPMKVATDLAIDSDFFQYVTRTKPWRAIYFSSSAAYPVRWQDGDASMSLREDLIHLDDPDLPDAVYGWVKLTGEHMARYANNDGAKIHVFRPFSGYGVDQDLDYPFPSFIKRARQRVKIFDIWGSGTQVRDWVHVDDVVDAVLSVMAESPADIGPVNIATGIPTDFLSLAAEVMKAARHSVPIRTHPDAPTGVHYRVGDPTYLNKFYTPRVTLAEGIDRALKGR